MPAKKKSAVPLRRAARKPAAQQDNPNLNAQTRKVLVQHYRAKYGVGGKR